jgi:hypothetical protein
MKTYIKKHKFNAGKWIYEGYKKAWENMGYETVYYNDISEIRDSPRNYFLMAVDSDIKDGKSLDIISNSLKSFIFAQPNTFPLPWGSHPNFHCLASDEVITSLNQMDNSYSWTFGDDISGHTKWKKVYTIPLAFDNFSYLPIKDESYSKYDICFVGGWADNGFNEKKPIMIKYFNEFKRSGIVCGFFINKNLTQEQENRLLYNSKISLNIHDAYQRALGFDTNERTFKSLGLNGSLLSDEVSQLERIFPNVKTTMEPIEMVRNAKEYLSLSEKELNEMKGENRARVLAGHCYTHRVHALLLL